MVTNNKVLTVSYGTFSCTLEGFDESFDTMKAIAEYFRDLAADDRYFGAEPPVPDAEMLARIAQRDTDRRVRARTDHGALVLTAGDALTEDDTEIEAAADTVAVAMPDEIAAPAPEAHVAVDEAQMAAEREAFYAGVDSSADTHATEVADDVALHQEALQQPEAPMVLTPAEAVTPTPAERAPEEPKVLSEAYADTPKAEAAPDVAEEIIAQEVTETEAEAPATPDLAETFVEDTAEDTAAEDSAEDTSDEDDAEEAYEDVDAQSFFAGTTTTTDQGVSSIAAKLSRIRAVVSQAESTEDKQPYIEDEHADNPAADFLRKSASDIEGSLEDTDDVDIEPAVQTGRVIRMRRSAELHEDESPVDAQANEDALAQPTAETPEAQTTLDVQEQASTEAPSLEIEELVGEDTVAEFENGYTAVALDDDAYDEEGIEDEAPVAPERPARPRASLPESPAEDDSVDRLLDEANSKLVDPAASQRRTTLAHLRKAVAATRAEKSAGTYKEQEDQSEAYREDLADVMRPRRQAPETAADDNAGMPLRLVASQRVDTEEQAETPAQDEQDIRPRRVSPADITAFETSDQSGFVEFAEEVGASELSDILEAAAAYLTYVEGRRRFSRPMLMRLAYQLGPDRFQREAGLRSFGQLLRDKKIEKIAGGRFTAAESIRFKPEDRAAG